VRDLARRANVPDLDVYARHLTWDMERPLTLSEVTAGATYTGTHRLTHQEIAWSTRCRCDLDGRGYFYSAEPSEELHGFHPASFAAR
jgi:hypothetical protein